MTTFGTERRAGPHRVTMELPDVLYLQLEGDVDVEHMKVFLGAVAEFPAEVHVLRDARKSRLVTASAREYMMKQMPKGKVVSFISFGAPFQARTVITMLARAIRLLNKDSPIVGFTNTEGEAR
ncbi:MAG TPA: hypothetical protein PK156_02215, partial [Polyangium sp.]|nr:hypothetical protein [Polyangium sp.]